MTNRPEELKYCQKLVHEYIMIGRENDKETASKYLSCVFEKPSPRHVNIIYRIGEELKRRTKFMKKRRFGFDDEKRRAVLMEIIHQHQDFLAKEFLKHWQNTKSMLLFKSNENPQQTI